MSKPVCILGCGPAGLFAAQAISELGGEPLIFSKKKKSELYGAQFLHKPIPGLTSQKADGWVGLIRFGDESLYADRVYGDPTVSTSWRLMGPGLPAWDLRKAYDAAWEKFEPVILESDLNYEEVADMTARFPVVISTVPAWAICDGTHKFESRNILVIKKAIPQLPIDGENFVAYNGMVKGDWYRSSRIFGHESTEASAIRQLEPWEEGKGQSDKRWEWEAGFKVVGTDCDCHPNLTRAGRMGKWERGVLTHHAFESAVEAFTEAMAV